MKIGFTEQGDAGLNLSWYDKLNTVDAAILITKQITDKFIESVITAQANGHKLIVHCGVTGWGGPVIEPHVPEYPKQLNQLVKLINSGFPKENCVIRIDPIWPTPNGLSRVQKLIHTIDSIPELKDIRIRISVLDEYKHVKQRIYNKGFQPIYGDRFSASKNEMQAVTNTLKQTGHFYECCAEPMLTDPIFIHQGCLSAQDMKIFGLSIPQNTAINPQNRHGCMCLTCKCELLNGKKHPCPHNCIYCYWKNK